MWLPCDCAEQLQQTSATRTYGGEEVWGGQAGCSCYGGLGGSSAFAGSMESRGFGGHRGSSGVGGYWETTGIEGSSDLESKGGVKGHKHSNRIGEHGGISDIGGKGGGKDGAGTKDGDEGIGDSNSGSDIGNKGGNGGRGIEGKKGDESVATAGKKGFMQNIHSLWTKLYDYWGPVGLWNLALATLLLGYYGKRHFWDTAKGRGSSTGGRAPHQLGGKSIKCPPKIQKRTPCCESCACVNTNRPRILKHKLKWPEEPCQ